MKKRLNGEGTYYHDTKRDTWQYKLVLGRDENDKPIRKSFYGKTADDARLKGLAALNELSGQKVSVSPDMNLGDWLKLYIDTYKKDHVQQKWHDMLLGFIPKIPTSLRNKKLSSVTPIELQKNINTISMDLSESYTKKFRTLLKSAFTKAQENGICVYNPAANLSIPSKPVKPRETYTAEEVRTIIAYAHKYKNKTIAGAAVTMLLTGIRRGELLGLEWDDVDTDTLHIRRGVFVEDNKPRVIDYKAKTKESIRNIPLPDLAYSFITNLPKSSNYVFSSTNGGLIEPNNFNRAYNTFMKHIAANENDFRILSPHSCRHTFATLTLLSGSNLRNVQILLGHTDPKTTAIYTHPDIDNLRQSSSRLIDLLKSPE